MLSLRAHFFIIFRLPSHIIHITLDILISFMIEDDVRTAEGYIVLKKNSLPFFKLLLMIYFTIIV